jgi:hypothetical protein
MKKQKSNKNQIKILEMERSIRNKKFTWKPQQETASNLKQGIRCFEDIEELQC